MRRVYGLEFKSCPAYFLRYYGFQYIWSMVLPKRATVLSFTYSTYTVCGWHIAQRKASVQPRHKFRIGQLPYQDTLVPFQWFSCADGNHSVVITTPLTLKLNHAYPVTLHYQSSSPQMVLLTYDIVARLHRYISEVNHSLPNMVITASRDYVLALTNNTV